MCAGVPGLQAIGRGKPHSRHRPRHRLLGLPDGFALAIVKHLADDDRQIRLANVLAEAGDKVGQPFLIGFPAVFDIRLPLMPEQAANYELPPRALQRLGGQGPRCSREPAASTPRKLPVDCDIK